MITGLNFNDAFADYSQFKVFTDALNVYSTGDPVSELFNQSIYYNIVNRYGLTELAYFEEEEFKNEFSIAFRQYFKQFLAKKKIIDDINNLTAEDYQLISESLSNFSNNPNALNSDPWELLTFTAQQQRGRAKAGKLTAYINALRQMPDAQIDAFLDKIDYMWSNLLDSDNCCYNEGCKSGTTIYEEGEPQSTWSPDAINDKQQKQDADISDLQTEVEDLKKRPLGTTIYDNAGNPLNNTKFFGKNGINVDASEEDPNNFDFRLDNTVTEKVDSAIQPDTQFINAVSNQTDGVNNDVVLDVVRQVLRAHLSGTASNRLARALLTPLTGTGHKLVGLNGISQENLLIGQGLQVSMVGGNDELDIVDYKKIPKLELVYDMSSPDPNINKGYTGGLQGNETGYDFGSGLEDKYSNLLFMVTCDENLNTSYVFPLNLTRPNMWNGFYACYGEPGCWTLTTTAWQRFFYTFIYSYINNVRRISAHFGRDDNMKSDDNNSKYIIRRIVGVLK